MLNQSSYCNHSWKEILVIRLSSRSSSSPLWNQHFNSLYYAGHFTDSRSREWAHDTEHVIVVGRTHVQFDPWFCESPDGPIKRNMGEYFKLAHYHNLMRMLPIHWDGPIALVATTAASSSTLAHYFLETALGCAHCICRYCCWWLHFGLLYFWEVLPMHSDGWHGPITLVGATANYFTLAHYFSGRCFS